MKKTIYSMVACAMIFAAVSCSSDDDNSSSTTPAQVTTTVTSGTWKVTQFNNSGTDETAHFANYNFTFGSSGTLTASNGTNDYTGNWSVTNDDSNDDNPGGDVDFNIAFASPDNFTELTEDWHILERTASKIRLQHISGGNGGTDLLTFQKN